MAKKKKSQNQQQFLSPEQYIKQRARSLAIGKCYMTKDIRECGEGEFIVTRMHTNGKISFASYLVDIYCLGVKDSCYYLRNEADDFYEMINESPLTECSYEELHNWIYGAVSFAQEAGIEPDRSFKLTQYMLEEDTDDIPLIEYEFGKDGKYFLICNSVAEANRYMPILEEHLGNNFQFVIEDGKNLRDLDDLDEETMNERLKNIEDSPMFKSYGPQTKYTYQHPNYPTELKLTTPDWFYEELNDPDNKIYLKEDLVNRILQLPYDLVRENLEKIILYHIGKTCEEIPEGYETKGFTGIVSNAVILLGEVGNTDSSLDVIIELLRQNGDFMEYHFGDAGFETYVPTLYLLGQNHLDYLMDFVKEEGIKTYSKCNVLAAVTQIAIHQPERRGEVIEWYRKVTRFATKMLPQTQWFDSELAGLLVCELIDIQAQELLPEIKKMFETGLVDLGICGNYAEVCRSIIDPRHKGHPDDCILNVYERFADMKLRWEY